MCSFIGFIAIILLRMTPRGGSEWVTGSTEGGQGKVSIEGRSQGFSAVGPSPGGITTELYAKLQHGNRSVLGNKKNTAYTMNLQRKCDKIFKTASYYKEQIFRWSRRAVIAHIALDTLGTKHSQSQGWRVICIQTTTWPHPTNPSHWTIQKRLQKFGSGK